MIKPSAAPLKAFGILLLVVGLALVTYDANADELNWDEIVSSARGQTVRSENGRGGHIQHL